MSILSRIAGRIAKLPPAETYDLLIERDLKVSMPDGVILLADRYASRGVEKPLSRSFMILSIRRGLCFRCWSKKRNKPLDSPAASPVYFVITQGHMYN